MEDKFVVLSREQVTNKLNLEYYENKDKAVEEVNKKRQHYSDAVWVSEKELLGILMMGE